MVIAFYIDEKDGHYWVYARGNQGKKQTAKVHGAILLRFIAPRSQKSGEPLAQGRQMEREMRKGSGFGFQVGTSCESMR
jgi:hypothetical protein